MNCTEIVLQITDNEIVTPMNLESISVSEIMNPIVKTVNEDKNIMSACKTMHKNKIGCVIIVTIAGDETPVGIITERDVMRILSTENPGLLHFALWKLMRSHWLL